MRSRCPRRTDPAARGAAEPDPQARRSLVVFIVSAGVEACGTGRDWLTPGKRRQCTVSVAGVTAPIMPAAKTKACSDRQCVGLLCFSHFAATVVRCSPRWLAQRPQRSRSTASVCTDWARRRRAMRSSAWPIARSSRNGWGMQTSRPPASMTIGVTGWRSSS